MKRTTFTQFCGGLNIEERMIYDVFAQTESIYKGINLLRVPMIDAGNRGDHRIQHEFGKAVGDMERSLYNITSILHRYAQTRGISDERFEEIKDFALKPYFESQGLR